MRRIPWAAVAVLAAALTGCVAGPRVDNPVFVQPGPAAVENPVFVPLGPPSYGVVFEKTLDVVSDYFEIDEHATNRYSGQIRTLPKVAPGLIRFLSPGSPDPRERLLATL